MFSFYKLVKKIQWMALRKIATQKHEKCGIKKSVRFPDQA